MRRVPAGTDTGQRSIEAPEPERPIPSLPADANFEDRKILIMDDDSRDGSVELVTARAEDWVQIVVRTGDRSLSAAVLEGLRRAGLPRGIALEIPLTIGSALARRGGEGFYRLV